MTTLTKADVQQAATLHAPSELAAVSSRRSCR